MYIKSAAVRTWRSMEALWLRWVAFQHVSYFLPFFFFPWALAGDMGVCCCCCCCCCCCDEGTLSLDPAAGSLVCSSRLDALPPMDGDFFWGRRQKVPGRGFAFRWVIFSSSNLLNRSNFLRSGNWFVRYFKHYSGYVNERTTLQALFPKPWTHCDIIGDFEYQFSLYMPIPGNISSLSWMPKGVGKGWMTMLMTIPENKHASRPKLTLLGAFTYKSSTAFWKSSQFSIYTMTFLLVRRAGIKWERLFRACEIC